MGLRVSGKGFDIGEALRGQVETRIGTAVEKYFDGGVSGHVTVGRDGTGYRADCVLHLSSGITLEAAGAAHDVPASCDQMVDRIETRLRRYKRRLKDRNGANGQSSAANAGSESAESVSATVFEAPGEELEAAEYHPVVVAETTKPLHALSVSEAVIRLDLTGAPIVVFRHAGTSRVNVVYRRNDGTIGWIDPPQSVNERA